MAIHFLSLSEPESFDLREFRDVAQVVLSPFGLVSGAFRV
jgi:hypothetical protein